VDGRAENATAGAGATSTLHVRARSAADAFAWW
jgi:hypothetical protein